MKITIIHGQNHKGCSYHVSRSLVEKLTTDEDLYNYDFTSDEIKNRKVWHNNGKKSNDWR